MRNSIFIYGIRKFTSSGCGTRKGDYLILFMCHCHLFWGKVGYTEHICKKIIHRDVSGLLQTEFGSSFLAPYTNLPFYGSISNWFWYKVSFENRYLGISITLLCGTHGRHPTVIFFSTTCQPLSCQNKSSFDRTISHIYVGPCSNAGRLHT